MNEIKELSSKRTILVTGAAGFIGSQVVKALAADQRTSANAGPSGDCRRIIAADVRLVPTVERLDNVQYLDLDVRSDHLTAIVAEHDVDTVVHLAAIVNPGPESSRELEYSVDVLGTRNVLEACISNGVRKLIVTSSGAAYGYHSDNRPLLTEDCPLRGNDEFGYARNKRLVEEMLADYRREHPELQQLIFRPGTVLGRSVQNQITALFEQPVLVGLSDAATPFVFITDEDVVACVIEGVFGDATGAFNLAGDGVMTLREIAARLGKRFVGVPSGFLERALTVLRRFDVTRYGPEQVRFLRYRPVLSNQRLKAEFGYRPKRTSRQAFELYLQGVAAR